MDTVIGIPAVAIIGSEACLTIGSWGLLTVPNNFPVLVFFVKRDTASYQYLAREKAFVTFQLLKDARVSEFLGTVSSQRVNKLERFDTSLWRSYTYFQDTKKFELPMFCEKIDFAPDFTPCHALVKLRVIKDWTAEKIGCRVFRAQTENSKYRNSYSGLVEC